MSEITIIKNLRDCIVGVYDYRLKPNERKIFYELLVNSRTFNFLKDTKPGISFRITLTEHYRPSEHLTFGTVLDQMISNITNSNSNSITGIYDAFRAIMSGIQFGYIIQDTPQYTGIRKEDIDKMNEVLHRLKNPTAASLEHPNTVSSSTAASQVPLTTVSSSTAASPVPLTTVSSSASAVPPLKKPGCGTGSCSISGGAGGRRRRGTKRARRGRRRSSRKQ